MRTIVSATLFFCLSSGVFAQAFECLPVGPLPVSCCAACEDVYSNNYGTGTGIDSAVSCGMPASGARYVRVTANAPYGPGPGIARPVPQTVSEVRILVPDGADGVSFKWNWHNAEAGSTEGAFNDGMEIAIISADGTTVLVPLVYVDTGTPLAPGGCADSFGPEVGINGVESFSAAFAPVPFGSVLSIVSFNGGDTALDSSGVVDCVAWGNPAAPSFERGNMSGPRVVDQSPATSFRIGQVTSVRVEAGLPFLEGDHCMVAQVYQFSSQPQFITPGIAGGLFIRDARPIVILSEGLLSGGANPGRSQTVSFTLSDPALCGVGIVIQAYVITEQLTNQTFTTALFGWMR